MAESKILKGIDAIRNYIDPENPPAPQMVREWIKNGLPARLIGRTWFSHKDHINKFFYTITYCDNRKSPKEIIESGE